MNSPLLKLNKNLFWDVNWRSIDFDRHKNYVVGRVLNYGDLDDYFEIERYYGLPVIKKVACELPSLDAKSINFFSLLLNIPKNKFICSRKHWRQKPSG